MDTYFAVTAPGLATVTHLELSRLALLPVSVLTDTSTANLPEASATAPEADLSFKGDLAALYRANLHLRTASRILVRLGMPFMARTFPELVEKASRLPWERFLTPGQPVALRVTCHKSKLYHSEAVAERLLVAIEARLGQPSPRLKASDEEGENPPQLILARLVDDKCTVSVDSSGELLHRRGYRQAVAKAPLRETLAAGMLLLSGWDENSPLLDPFCGSGTIPIEAALMALGIPPGIHRRFAFMDWPNYDDQLWRSLLAGATESARRECPPILASDRDAGAVKMARENAQRAGVDALIQFECQAVSAIQSPKQHGWVVTNPPYGLRVSEGRDLRNLYAQLGKVLRAQCPGWQAAILCSDLFLLGHTGLKLDTSAGLVNGGVRVKLGRGPIPK